MCIRDSLNPLHPRMLYAKFGWNWPSGSGEGDFYIWSMFFCYFEIISPWKRAGPFMSPLHPRMHFAKFGWNWPSGCGEKDFLILSMYFCDFVIISPWKRVGPFIWTNLNPLHPRMLCAMFGWNWPSGSGVEDENVKRFTTKPMTPTTTMDNGHILIRKAHLSLWLRWAKNQIHYSFSLISLGFFNSKRFGKIK